MGQAGKFQPHDLARTVELHALDDVAVLGRLRTVAPDRLFQAALSLGVFTDQDVKAFPFGHLAHLLENKKSARTKSPTNGR